jgi:hypothetical protein
MSDMQVLVAVRKHLLSKELGLHVHLTLPPKAIYPLVLIELEEIWSTYPLKVSDKRKNIQARVKFKVSAYSRGPGLEEAADLSHKTRNVLEGATLQIPTQTGGVKSSILRFLACVTESSVSIQGAEGYRVIHHFYDCIIRG